MLRDRSPTSAVMSPNAGIPGVTGAPPEEQRAELDRMRKEKLEMNHKLEEFA